MKKFFLLCIALASNYSEAFAQISMSGGAYGQNFNSLGSSSVAWTNNATLPGWYASKNSADSTNYFASTGTSTTGGLYSFGVNGVNGSSDRALGSVASGSADPNAYGVRFTNDTASVQSNIVVSYTGEQWRVGSTNTTQSLAFSYAVTNSPITNSFSAATWINFTALNFNSPATNPLTSAIDGNAATNRQLFTNVTLTNVTVQPGQELFLRWLDVDDGGSDHGLALDDLTVNFTAVASSPPGIITQPASLSVTEGDNAEFSVHASGTAPLSYQWHFYGTNLPGATDAMLSLTNVSAANAGTYDVTVTNSLGSTNSAAAVLTVNPAPQIAFSLLTYNVKGNGETNWTTNSTHVQAIGRVVQYLNPDIITFNEIPLNYTYEMTNFVAAYLPGYKLAANSGTDGFIRSVIASRYPIVRTNKWLDFASLTNFGYDGHYTRDLFEAQITVPGISQRVHVFTTHLKSSSGGYTDAALKRAAEAAAITNFFATNFFAYYSNDLYTLSGDMNEDNTNTLAIQRLVSAPMGLQMQNPVNPTTGSSDTYTSTNPTSRLDYIFPCTVLSSNVNSKQVFRADKIGTPPSPLTTNDTRIASDHLPVLMVFNNPYAQTYTNPVYKILYFTVTNQTATFKWESLATRIYNIEFSSDFTNWSIFKSNLVASSKNFTFTTNVPLGSSFFRVYRQP